MERKRFIKASKIFMAAVLVLPLFLFSCKSTAPSAPLDPDESGQPPETEQISPQESSAEDDPSLGTDLDFEPGEESFAAGEEFPESDLGGDEPYEEEPALSILPEEETPETLAHEQAPLAVVPAAPEPVSPQPVEPPLVAAQPTAPPTAPQPTTPPPTAPPPTVPQRQEPPQPPSFLMPAEPEPPPVVRQPVPVPINPLPELPDRQRPETAEEEIIFSRIVRATVGQMIEIPFRGTGWVYLGELGNRRGISYDSRRLDITTGTSGSSGFIEGQSFIFRAEAAGIYILKFYKHDFIQDYIINDHVQVIVGDDPEFLGGRFGSPVDRGRVIAEPRWPLVPETRTQETGPAADSETDSMAAEETISIAQPPDETLSPAPAAPTPAAPVTVRPRQSSGDDGIVPVAPPQAAASAQQNLSSPELIPSDAPISEYIRRARLEFDAGRVESALTILDAMKQRYPSGSDEAWWLYGQLLEANSSSRDVRLALEYYRRLVREYPQSSRAGDAQRRIAYLERFYFNIR